MESLRVEYLIIINGKGAFCSDEKCFNKLLQVNSNIHITNNTMKYKELSVNYNVTSDDIQNSNLKFYHLKLICNDISKINLFEQLLSDVREILYKVSEQAPQTIWNDISFYYATKSYPLINEIENLMRKLITQFMLTNVGIGWSKANVPNSVKQSIRKTNVSDSNNYLYETDFIQLANFLFDKYETKPMTTLLENIKKASSINDLKLDDLKNYVPISNWEKYFSNLVDCDNSYLHSRWKSLYELRCKVAHNNTVSKEDYAMINKLVNELKEKLEKAITSLDKIHISELDKEIIVENTANNINTLIGSFMIAFGKLEKELIDFHAFTYNNFAMPIDLKSKPIRLLCKDLLDLRVINNEFYSKIEDVVKFRNIIAHNVNFPSEDEFHQYINLINKLFGEIQASHLIGLIKQDLKEKDTN